MAYLTPPLWAKGRYTVTTPFVVEPTKVYMCVALRSFDDVVRDGDLVFEKYYEPMNLPLSTYNDDKANDAVIITLVDEFGDMIYFPNSFLESFPNMGDVPYHHLVLSCSLGPVPEYLDVSTLVELIQTGVTETVGIVGADVKTHVAPARSAVSPEQHDILEANRLAGITYGETYKALLLKEQAKTARLEEKVGVLTQILIDKGILV